MTESFVVSLSFTSLKLIINSIVPNETILASIHSDDQPFNMTLLAMLSSPLLSLIYQDWSNLKYTVYLSRNTVTQLTKTSELDARRFSRNDIATASPGRAPNSVPTRRWACWSRSISCLSGSHGATAATSGAAAGGPGCSSEIVVAPGGEISGEKSGDMASDWLIFFWYG